MGEAGHHVPACSSARSISARLQVLQLVESVDGVAHPQPEIGRDLVVARARGVQPPGGLPISSASRASTFMWMSSSATEKASSAKPVAAFAITDLEGKEVTLDAFKGKVVVLNLWATWCVPCIKEMPSLERLSVKMKDKGVAVMSVSQDRGGMKQVGPFLDKHGLKALPIYLDAKGTVLKAIAGRGLPTTLVIDKEGREIGRLEGDAEWDGPHAAAIIEHALK
jgi:thiol-disulfide isomerase/thioredoxin